MTPPASCDGLGVGGPVRRRDEDLVARVEERREGLEDRLLAAVGDQHLARRDAEAGVPGGLVGHGLPQLGKAGRGRVLVEPRLRAGPLGCLDDVAGGGEVRFAGPEPDDRPAGRLERLGLGVHRQGG